MTENEAIKNFQQELKEPLSPFSITMCNLAIQALEEIQKYRVIGTVEDILKGIKQSEEEFEMLMKYREIGTIEEFKALKEKNTPKKPIYSNFDENELGYIIPYKAVCPICGHEFEFGTWNDEQNHHCECGQKLDWEGGE